MSTVRRLFLRYKEAWHDRKTVKITFFCTLVILSALLAFSFACLSRGESSRYFLWYKYEDLRGDTFMDFFNSVNDADYDNPYVERGVIYPPLANVLYRLFGRYARGFFITDEAHDFRHSQEALMFFFLYLALSSMLFFAAGRALMGAEKRPVVLFALYFSCPFLYLFERGNLLLVAVSCLMLYLAWYDSDDPLLGELALVMLAVAVNLKIYPVVFGLLLLTPKHKYRALRCILYGALLFVLPMFFFGGWSNFRVMIERVTDTGRMFDQFTYSKVDLGNLLLILARETGWQWLGSVASCATMIGVPIVLYAFLCCRPGWKKWLALSLFCAFFPTFGFAYVPVYLVPPLLAFLREPLTRKADVAYLVCLTLPFGYIPFTLTRRFGLLLRYHTDAPRLWELVCSLSMLVLTVLLLVDATRGLAAILRERRERKERPDAAPAPADPPPSRPDTTAADGAPET